MIPVHVGYPPVSYPAQLLLPFTKPTTRNNTRADILRKLNIEIEPSITPVIILNNDEQSRYV